MKKYIISLEKEFSLIKNGFKEEEKRALTDYKSNDSKYIKMKLIQEKLKEYMQDKKCYKKCWYKTGLGCYILCTLRNIA